jgi:hypothetical protein
MTTAEMAHTVSGGCGNKERTWLQILAQAGPLTWRNYTLDCLVVASTFLVSYTAAHLLFERVLFPKLQRRRHGGGPGGAVADASSSSSAPTPVTRILSLCSSIYQQLNHHNRYHYRNHHYQQQQRPAGRPLAVGRVVAPAARGPLSRTRLLLHLRVRVDGAAARDLRNIGRSVQKKQPTRLPARACDVLVALRSFQYTPFPLIYTLVCRQCCIPCRGCAPGASRYTY